ncbi:hypothetical protein H6S10_12945 [Escherichia coli]|nr:hypothetical protein H6S10_12945 [Escherichia coli]
MTITPATHAISINPATVNNFLCCRGLALTISKTHFSWRQQAFATGARQI